MKTDPNADVDDSDKNDDNQVQKLSLKIFERLLFTISIYPKSLNLPEIIGSWKIISVREVSNFGESLVWISDASLASVGDGWNSG